MHDEESFTFAGGQRGSPPLVRRFNGIQKETPLVSKYITGRDRRSSAGTDRSGDARVGMIAWACLIKFARGGSADPPRRQVSAQRNAGGGATSGTRGRAADG